MRRFSRISLQLIGSIVLSTLVAASMAAESDSSRGFAAAERLEGAELDSLRGREGFADITNVQSIQNLDASVSHSSFHADTIRSGAITIEAQALENFGGIGLFNLVTGNNNAVNSGVGVSIYMAE
ncbi:hypothetical protein [Aidingimonas halophila]|uniref:Uncharacterized protein n=1 Tax=Aidingimonas halophila TaxID=574349 RepID=A0A1H2XLR6_9GAMM|nr:hypothetical protein [Aidingimonas halophila]GHC28964.1 hypothetical protein GCM10008094_21220 [Aidingimonas halophila]SDW93841.1 hypothetical protein SAMN05443545_103240 [Aidingimonas halophila]